MIRLILDAFHRLRPLALCANLCIALAPFSTAQAQWQDLAGLRQAAENFAQDQLRNVTGKVVVAAASPEPRLRLPACNQLLVFLPPGTKLWGHASVGVRCESPSQWSLYLPVTVRILSEVVVASRPIYRGQLISESDIAVQQSDLTQLPAGVFLRAEDVIGKTAKSSIGGGMALFPALLRATQVVGQGDTVRLAYAGDGFEVNSSGRALTAGGVGEEVEVRSVSGRVLKGVVKDKGLVWVR